MKRVTDVKELIDLSYNKFKSKNAITIENGYEKNINYFNYKFDIYSLARAIKSKHKGIKNPKVAILSENRYEFLVTYLANIILKNAIIIIDSNSNKVAIEKIIKKQQINTIFFSNKNKEKITEIYRLNENNKSKNKRKIINLINFDSNNKFPIIEYEKLINIGRYIENYSINNEVDLEYDDNTKSTIIINTEGTKEYSEEDLIQSAYIIGESIKLKKKKKIESLYEINSFYTIVTEILLPVMYGLNIQYGLLETQNKKIKNIEMQKDTSKEAVIKYGNNRYKIENIGLETYVIKIGQPRRIWKKNRRLETTNFILIKSGKEEKVKDTKDRITI